MQHFKLENWRIGEMKNSNFDVMNRLNVLECGRVCGFVADFIVAMNGHIKTPLGVKVTPIKCLRKSDSQDVIKKGNSRL